MSDARFATWWSGSEQAIDGVEVPFITIHGVT